MISVGLVIEEVHANIGKVTELFPISVDVNHILPCVMAVKQKSFEGSPSTFGIIVV